MTRSDIAKHKVPLLLDHPHQTRQLTNRALESNQPHRIVAFDLERVVLDHLFQVLPGWQIDIMNGVTLGTLADHWDPDTADLLLVRVSDNLTRTLGLCRFLSSCTDYSFNAREWKTRNQNDLLDQPIVKHGAPLFVLSPSFNDSFLHSAKKVGAENFVHLPLEHRAVEQMVTQSRRKINTFSPCSAQT